MFGQSFFIKKIAQSVVQEFCEAFDMDEDDAREVAKGAALLAGIGSAIVTLDFLGGAATVGEEVAEEAIGEFVDDGAAEVFASSYESIASSSDIVPKFGGGVEVVHNWSTNGTDAVFERVFTDGYDQFGNHISAIRDQSVSYGMLDFTDKQA